MNYSTAVMLFNPEIRAISVSYEVNEKKEGVKPFYTFKTLDKTIVKGDLVVVPTDTRHQFTVVRVEEEEVEVDYESNVQFKWVAGKVDLAAYSNVLTTETKMIDTMKAAEKQHKREEIKNKVQEFYKGQDLTQLALVSHVTDAKVTEVSADASAK